MFTYWYLWESTSYAVVMVSCAAAFVPYAKKEYTLNEALVHHHTLHTHTNTHIRNKGHFSIACALAGMFLG